MSAPTHCHHGRSLKTPCHECDESWRQWQIRSLKHSAEKLGLAVVPKELPEDLAAVGAEAYDASPCMDLIGPLQHAWSAMIEAAQKGEG